MHDCRYKLLENLRQPGKVMVALSGGVDSSVLLAAALDALGPEMVLAVTIDSPLVPREEIIQASEVAAYLGARHLMTRVDELSVPEIAGNVRERCYYCKTLRLQKLKDLACEYGLKGVLDGSNASDLTDYRPGIKAVLETGGVRAPLLETGLNKEDIRELARCYGLPNAERPSSACLASRIPFDSPLTRDKLQTVEKAEAFLRGLGLKNVRVRHHGEVARIELDPADMDAVLSRRDLAAIAEGIKACGFRFAALDLDGYRSGSLNPGPDVEKSHNG